MYSQRPRNKLLESAKLLDLLTLWCEWTYVLHPTDAHIIAIPTPVRPCVRRSGEPQAHSKPMGWPHADLLSLLCYILPGWSWVLFTCHMLGRRVGVACGLVFFPHLPCVTLGDPAGIFSNTLHTWSRSTSLVNPLRVWTYLNPTFLSPTGTS